MAKVKFNISISTKEKARRERQRQEQQAREARRQEIIDRVAALAGKKEADISLRDIYEQNQIIIELLTNSST